MKAFREVRKRRMKYFRWQMIEPDLAILDELDSGLDIDSLKQIAESLNLLHNEGNSYLIITHYQRLLDYVKPDRVHIMNDGKIVLSGDSTLASDLEEKGYEGIMSN